MEWYRVCALSPSSGMHYFTVQATNWRLDGEWLLFMRNGEVVEIFSSRWTQRIQMVEGDLR